MVCLQDSVPNLQSLDWHSSKSCCNFAAFKCLPITTILVCRCTSGFHCGPSTMSYNSCTACRTWQAALFCICSKPFMRYIWCPNDACSHRIESSHLRSLQHFNTVRLCQCSYVDVSGLYCNTRTRVGPTKIFGGRCLPVLYTEQRCSKRLAG